MAGFKTSKNLLQSRTEYSRYLSAFRGVDFSSDHTEVHDSRFAYAVNMYKDYRSGQGDAIETIPGFRVVVNEFDGKPVHGIHVGCEGVYLHVGKELWRVGTVDESGKITIAEEKTKAYNAMPDSKTASFCFGEKLYIIGGGYYLSVDADGVVERVSDNAYIPTTYRSIDPGAQYDSIAEDYGEGKEYEQRNMLQQLYKTTYVADGKVSSFELNENFEICEEAHTANTAVNFPRQMEIYQYGVLLPIGKRYGSAGDYEYEVPEGYPNAVKSMVNSLDGTTSVITLVNPPPAPEENTWNGSSFDQVSSGYDYPFAYPTGYAGIEIVAKKNYGNYTDKVAAKRRGMITGCTLATVFDNRIFLSGNPKYPQHIFWSAIPAGSERPDPSYFGILNYSVEGVADAPVVAMLPVADTLMVIKKDSEVEGSVLFHTPTLTGEDITPKVYPSTQGLYGVGCVGPCINFHDDPIFLSRFGVEAMGQLSVRYERAIEHRSSLIDAKLINCDLENASLAEWEGYLLLLTEGRIFMADSRQRFTHESGVNQYEWYYLEDIGVYKGQFPEYVFADFALESGDEGWFSAGDERIYRANAVVNEGGVSENLIGELAFEAESEISFIETDEERVYYKEIPIRDEHGNETGDRVKYYVEPTGAMTGGEFDPAVLLKVSGGDLFFATRDGVLCKFNFDKRDKETGLIPTEYYDFNGRTIFSGIATKMDNCGIPHLTKNTVKRSTVIKTRNFAHSGAKVKVRTNKKGFNQVGRIISGKATFDDADFISYTFSMEEKSLFSINEKEKKWVEKQHFIYSDEFRRPFAIHYLAYRYNVAGRYKE